MTNQSWDASFYSSRSFAWRTRHQRASMILMWALICVPQSIFATLPVGRCSILQYTIVLSTLCFFEYGKDSRSLQRPGSSSVNC
jgi:hypothetical protein